MDMYPVSGYKQQLSAVMPPECTVINVHQRELRQFVITYVLILNVLTVLLKSENEGVLETSHEV